MSFATMLKELLTGLATSFGIFALTLLFSLPLGLVVAFGRMSKNKIISAITQVYISVMRGTPLMLQLLVVFYGPYYMFGISLHPTYRFISVIIGFSLNYAAYFAEIYRGGIESIPKGQYEAAQVLCYTKSQSFTKIILPQVIKRITPAVTNEVITLIKDTSLAFTLSIPEMFTNAKAIAAAEKSMAAFVAAGIFYYIFNLVVATVMRKIEKSMDYYN